LPTPRACHFGSYSLAVEPVATTLKALARREAANGFVSWDPNVRLNVEPALASWRALADDMLPLAALVKASDEDVRLMYPDEEPEAVAARWARLGPTLVVLTRGAEGVVAIWGERRIARPARATRLVDTVGAGDTFMAALLARLDETQALSRAALAELDDARVGALLDFAAQAAAITCGRRGADLPRRSELPAS
jgi:fructokinase